MTPPPFHVTWIAPEVRGLAPLAGLSELGQIADMPGIELTVVTGPTVNRAHVSNALRQRSDVVIWSGHGRPGRLVLPCAEISAKWLAAQVRAALPRLVVLAACGSLVRDEHLKSMAEELSRAGVNVVGFPLETEDTAAVVFTVELVRSMSAGCAVGQAFDVAMEEICGRQTAAGVFLVPGLTNGYRDFELRLEAVEAMSAETRDLVRLLLEHAGIDPLRTP
jgi:hypothetical protein